MVPVHCKIEKKQCMFYKIFLNYSACTLCNRRKEGQMLSLIIHPVHCKIEQKRSLRNITLSISSPLDFCVNVIFRLPFLSALCPQIRSYKTSSFSYIC